jgi:acetoin utilization deacetylase AcuC-like enzyme
MISASNQAERAVDAVYCGAIMRQKITDHAASSTDDDDGRIDVFFHPRFYEEYTGDPAAETGRMEAIVEAITPLARYHQCSAASETDLLAVHAKKHIEQVRRLGLYEIAALAAGGAIEAARASIDGPSFGLIRPPGHHASASSAWGFCYFNNVAVSLCHLRSCFDIGRAFVLDFDLHFGDGNVNILGNESWVEILNPESREREAYLTEVGSALEEIEADVIAVSAGFDHHLNDWGGLLHTDDYRTIGRWTRRASNRNRGACYGLLEGGYNHAVLGNNVRAFIEGLLER